MAILVHPHLETDVVNHPCHPILVFATHAHVQLQLTLITLSTQFEINRAVVHRKEQVIYSVTTVMEVISLEMELNHLWISMTKRQFHTPWVIIINLEMDYYPLTTRQAQ